MFYRISFLNFRFIIDFNYYLGIGNLYMKDRRKKGFNEGINLVENVLVVYS